jgi:hypothetical protein
MVGLEQIPFDSAPQVGVQLLSQLRQDGHIGVPGVTVLMWCGISLRILCSLYQHISIFPMDVTTPLGPLKRAEAARHLLFHLHHPNIPFPLIVVKGNTKVGHERQHFTFEVTETNEQVHRRRLFGAKVGPRHDLAF